MRGQNENLNENTMTADSWPERSCRNLNLSGSVHELNKVEKKFERVVSNKPTDFERWNSVASFASLASFADPNRLGDKRSWQSDCFKVFFSLFND